MEAERDQDGAPNIISDTHEAGGPERITLGGRPNGLSARPLTLLPWVPTTPRCRHKRFQQLHGGPLPTLWRRVLPHTLLPSRPELLKAVRVSHPDSGAKMKEDKGAVTPLLREAIPLTLSYSLPNQPWCEAGFYQTRSKDLDVNLMRLKLTASS